MTIHLGDCLTVMAGMEPDSVDSVVTDPPYALAFMGKHWDEHPTPPAFQAWCEAWGREALRVTKPGGYLLAFGGTRTHHRLVCGLEDAGWIIRDELDWIYASGFPKGKANLKPAHEPIVLARKPGPLRALAIDACRIGYQSEAEVEVVKNRSGGSGGAFAGDIYGEEAPGYRVNGERFANVNPAGRWPSNVLLSDPELFDAANSCVVGSGATDVGDWSKGRYMKPDRQADGMFAGGRLDESNTYDDSGGYSRFFIVPKADRADREPLLRGQLEAKQHQASIHADPNAAWADKNPNHPRENAHPTVKPTDLMRHLVRLVTPAGGTVLDCFLGSGSTAIAAEMEGFSWIGIEKEPEYVAIAEARLNGVQRGLGLDVPAPIRNDIGKQRGNKDENGNPTLAGPASASSWFHDIEPPEEAG